VPVGGLDVEQLAEQWVEHSVPLDLFSHLRVQLLRPLRGLLEHLLDLSGGVALDHHFAARVRVHMQVGRCPELQGLSCGLVGGRPGGRSDDAAVAGVGDQAVDRNGRVDNLEMACRSRPNVRAGQLCPHRRRRNDCVRDELARFRCEGARLVATESE
jgi:hypothetical protein